jgi:hypothetical protein
VTSSPIASTLRTSTLVARPVCVLSSSTDPAVLTVTTSGTPPAAGADDSVTLEAGVDCADDEDGDPAATGGPPLPGWPRLA